jgi:hypothetical protein
VTPDSLAKAGDSIQPSEGASMPIERARELLDLAGDRHADRHLVHGTMQAFADGVRDASAGEVGEALAVLGQAFALEHSPVQALVLTAAGAVVERGADAAPLVAPAIDFLRRATPLALTFHRTCAPQVASDADDPHEAFRRVAAQERATSPPAAAAWDALDDLYPPLIAILAASPAARAQGRALAADMAEMRQDHAGASWLWPMLMVLDKEPLLVIEPETGLGVVGTMSDISSNFELHVLLMDVFPQAGTVGSLRALATLVGLRKRRRVSQRARDIVRGVVADQGGEPVIGQWNLHAWTALQATGRLSQGHEEQATAHWIWNEGVPADIPEFEGHRVVLLGPPSYERNFDAQRRFAGLRPDIEVQRMLSADEVEAWVKRLSAPAGLICRSPGMRPTAAGRPLRLAMPEGGAI